MTHHWHAAYVLGDYHATYSVYVGTLDGDTYAGYSPGTITLSWVYEAGGLGTMGGGRVDPRGKQPVPSPGALSVALVTLGAVRPRRPR
jgi:hypothetical protein